jgi:hypothetical protein
VDPVPDLLLLRKSGSARNPTRASGSVGRNCDHWTIIIIIIIIKLNKKLKEWFVRRYATAIGGHST